MFIVGSERTLIMKRILFKHNQANKIIRTILPLDEVGHISFDEDALKITIEKKNYQNKTLTRRCDNRDEFNLDRDLLIQSLINSGEYI